MGLGDWNASLLLSLLALFREEKHWSLYWAQGQICTTPVLRLPQTPVPTLSRAVTVRLKPQSGSLLPDMH